MDVAVHSRDNKRRLVEYSLKAMIKSKYTRCYLLNVTILRFLLRIEKND